MPPYTVNALLEALNRGETFDYIFFWGHRPQPDGRIGPSCCSQWFAAGFELEGVHYRTAEHFMMAEEARMFGDTKMAARILEAPTPQEAKGLGRKVAGFDQALWDARCYRLVVKGNTAKFGKNPRLGAWLLSTSPKVMAEAGSGQESAHGRSARANWASPAAPFQALSAPARGWKRPGSRATLPCGRARNFDRSPEASPLDPVWGIGLHREDPRSSDPRQWEGTNLLGFALMEVRDDLKGEAR